MGQQRSAGALWLVAGLSSAGIAFFLDQPLDLAIFISGAVLASLLGLGMLVRPSVRWVPWSNLLGAAWVVVFGAVILTRLSIPIEQILSVVWILGFGAAAAILAYVRRSRTAMP